MLTLTDLFCGAGGSSTGAVQVPGVQVRVASNHWQLAVDTHEANHPDTGHVCADLSQIDPRFYPSTDILWASPECFAAGTLILTKRGLVPIEDVTVGDKVMTHEGRYRPVTHVMSRRADTVRLIGQGNSRGLEVTSEHPILTSRSGGIEWVNVEDIILDRDTRWATPTEHPPASIPPIGGSRPLHVDDTRFAWLVGRWLGDGSLRVRDGKSSETFITCGKHEAADLEQHLTWVIHNCGVCAPELTWSRRELRTAYVYANSHSELAKWLVEHFGIHAHGKTVPAWALGAPVEWRRALLDGYLSADGYDDGRGWRAASVSKSLALGIRLLAESLGHRVSLTYSHRDTWRIEGRVGRARPQWSVSWLHHINRVTSRTATECNGLSWGAIKAVEPANSGVEVYDLTVDEDHSYVADGIVVHNCTTHSIARGARTVRQPDLFNPIPDEAVERSRATMWDVPRFTEVHRYQAVIVENVVDVARWAPYRAWLEAMDSLGYAHEVVFINSMHAWAHGDPAPQSRDRFYAVFWRKGNRRPDLQAIQRPPAMCPEHGRVEAIKTWKNERRAGRYRSQYYFRCPHTACRGRAVEPAWLPAASIIDWSNLGTRIGDRSRPLAEKTMKRIQAGIDRYWSGAELDPLLVNHVSGACASRSTPVSEVAPTMVAGGTHASLLVPVEGREGKAAVPAVLPYRTQTARNETGVVMAMHLEAAGNTYDSADPRRGGDYFRIWPDGEPMRTVHATASKGAVFPPFLAELRGGSSDARPADDPLSTVTASGNHHALISSYYGKGGTTTTEDPLPTVMTRDRHALIMRNNNGRGDLGYMSTPVDEPIRTVTTAGHQSLITGGTPSVEDCMFRMLTPDEIKQAMAFPADYELLGTKRDQVRMSGNAVTPPAARDLVAAVAESLEAA